MALDRQYLVEILDAQGQQVGILSASRINVVDSKITGTTPGTAASIVTYAGNGQSGTAGANIAIPPSVRVLDANGLPVAGSSVTWFHGGGSGTTSTGTVTTTNSNGVSQVGSWSLGTTAGSVYTLFAYSGNLTNSPIRFSCTPTAGSAFSATPSGGTSQTTTAAGTLASRCTVLVHDQYGNPVNGHSVDWASTDPDATFGTNPGVTNSSGVVGTTYTAGTAAPSVASMTAAISSATSARFSGTIEVGTPVIPIIVQGDGQVAVSDTTLGTNPMVFVGDAFQNPISSGHTVQFVIVTGSGNISSTTTTPTAAGLAQVEWKLDSTAGLNQLEVSVKGISNSTVTFSASGTNPLADTIFPVAGIGQSATVATALGAPIRWGVTGSGASAVGQVVDLAVTGDAVLSASQVVSTSTGLVNVTVTAGTVASIYTVTATAGGLTGSPSEITFAGVAGSATSLVVQTQPTSNPVPGVAWPQQPVIVSTDVYGNLVSTNTRVGAVLTSGDGTLASAVSMFAVASGATANFSGLSYTQVSSNVFQVVYRCNSLSTATGDQQTAQPPFATKLGFTVQPTGGTTSSGPGVVTVAVQDSTGATVGNATDPVTLALGSNPGGATLSGTLTVPATSGLATFSDLGISAAGDGYTLAATATGLTGATSASFNMTAPTGNTNEPAGFTRFMEWDPAVTTSLPSTTEGAFGTDGVWYCERTGSQSVSGGRYNLRFPTGIVGTDPGNLHVWDTAANVATEQIYFHLSDFQPGLANGEVIGATTGDGFYQNHAVDTKILHIKLGGTGGGTGAAILRLRGNGTANALMSAFRIDLLSKVPNLTYTQNLNSSFLCLAGQSNDIQGHVKMNTLGQSNGEFHLWVNGTKVAQHTNCVFRQTGSTNGIYDLWFDNTYGGTAGGGTRNRVDYWRWGKFYASRV